MFNNKLSEFKKRENELYNTIRNLSQECDRLEKEGTDTTEIYLRLKATLEEFMVFRKEYD